MLAGIIAPDSGQVKINGKVSPFLELGVGFQEELTAIDNIYLYGALLGMTKSQIDKKLNDIIAFSELEKFVNTPLKHFSSGMYVRLAFSVAIHADFDILLLDEVLAVGDYTFQQKCLQKFNEIKQNNKTVIFVSHDIHTVSQICHRCIWIDSGQIKKIGPSLKITEEYMKDISETNTLPTVDDIKEKNNILLFESISFQNQSKKNIFHSGEEIIIKINFQLQLSLHNPVVGINIYNNYGICVFALNTSYKDIKLGQLKPGRHQVEFKIKQYLAHGDYHISVAICDQTKTKIYFSREKSIFFKVINQQYRSDGLADFPSQISIN
jgi:lipopolysaccharide transport system ATP-binding protein